MENIITKQHLIEYISFIRDSELDKPINEINDGLVKICINLLLKLQGKEANLSTEQIKQKTDNIPFILTPEFDKEKARKTKMHIKAKRLLIVAATITLLYTLMSFCISFSGSKESDSFNKLVEAIGLENIVFGKTYNVNGTSYTENKYLEQYDDINDYPKDNPHNILFPKYMPEGTRLASLYVSDEGENKYSILVASNIPTLSYSISPDTEIPQIIIDSAPEATTINDKTVYIVPIQEINQYQMYFEHDGDFYELVFTDKEELLKIIESME